MPVGTNIQPINVNNVQPKRQTFFRGKTVPVQDYPLDTVEINGKKRVNVNSQSSRRVPSTGETGMSKGAKWGIGLGVLGGIAIAVSLIAKGKVKEAKQLAEHIDFTEAKTLEEAIKWGKENFGIKHYRGFEEQDLSVINWVNEGLTNINNKLKGKWKTPRQIQYREREEMDTLAAMISKATGKYAKWNGFFEINKKAFRNINLKIESLIEAMEKGDIITVNGNKFSYCNWFSEEDFQLLAKDIMLYKQGKITNFKDKVKLYESLYNLKNEIYSINEAPLSKIKQIIKHENIAKLLKEKGIQTDIEEIKKMTVKEQNQLVSNIMDKIGDKIYFQHVQGNVFHTIYHEIGHLQDGVVRIGAKDKFKNYSEYPKELKEWLDNDENMQIASRISEYATTGPGEFIAETFADLIAGKKLPDEVMALYKKLNGPMV